MLLRPKLIILISFLLLEQGATAQNCKYNIHQFESENGLPTNGIKGLEWDEQTGFLWIATEAGVVRYNGQQFKQFTEKDGQNISADRVNFFFKNISGGIYARNQNGQYYTMDKNQVKFISSPNRNGNNSFSLYALTISEKLFKDSTKTTSTIFPFYTSSILPINDSAFLVKRINDLYMYKTSFKDYKKLDASELKISTVFKVNDGLFFKTLQNDIFRLNPITEKISHYKINFLSKNIKVPKEIEILYHTGNNSPILVAGKTAWQLNFTNDSLNATFLFDEIPTNLFYLFGEYSSKLQTLFLGTDSRGLVVIKKHTVSPMVTALTDGNKRQSYYSQIELAPEVVLTNERHFIGKKDSSVAKKFDFINNKFGNHLAKLNKHELLYTKKNEEGLYNPYLYNDSTKKTYQYKKIIVDERFITIFVNKKIYFSDEFGFGFFASDSLNYIYKYPKKVGFANRSCLFEIEKGTIAIGLNLGILRFNIATQKIDTLLLTNNRTVRTMRSLNGYVFIGTYGAGIYVYKDGKIKALPLDKSEYLLYSHCFMPDKNGFCWISSNRGLFKARISTLIDAFNTSSNLPIYYHFYGQADGMLTTELNGGCSPCALTMQNGVFSFPTMYGLLWVDPTLQTPGLLQSQIYLDGFSANNKQYNIDSLKNLTLPSKTNNIIIKLVFASWNGIENDYLEYKLDNDPWKKNSGHDLSILQFIQLGYGHHIVNVRKKNGFEETDIATLLIEFTIAKPWTSTIWFFLVCLLGLSGLIYLITKLRTRQYKRHQKKLESLVLEKTQELHNTNSELTKNNAIKTRLITIINHDIIAPLRFLSLASKSMETNIDTESLESQKQIAREIANTSKQLELLSSNMLNWIKYQTQNKKQSKSIILLFELAQAAIAPLQAIAKKANVQIVNQISEDATFEGFIDPIKIIVYNLIANALKFTSNEITVNCHETNSHLIISVIDNGPGMTREQIAHLHSPETIIMQNDQVDARQGHGLGYPIIHDLLAILKGTLDIQSEIGKGTEVSVSFPKTSD